MKKLLIATSALVAAAGVANAAEPIKLAISGSGSGYVAYASQKDSFLKATGIESNAVDVKGKNTLVFSGKTTLDNGLTVKVEYEYEAGGKDQGNINDKWRIFTSGAFGTIRMAADGPASDGLSVGGPEIGVKIMGDPIDNDLKGKLVLEPVASAVALVNQSGFDVSTGGAPGASDQDSENIAYYTPAIYGFTLGASYHPSARIGNNNVAPSSNAEGGNDEYTVGLKFDNKFGDVGLKLSAGYAVVDVSNEITGNTGNALEANIDDHSDWGFGGVVSYKGFAANARYRKTELSTTSAIRADAANSDNRDNTQWQVGVSYAANPYTIQLQYVNGQKQNLVKAEGKDKIWELQLTGQYIMGPGVTLEAAVGYVDMKNGYSAAQAALDPAIADKSKNAGWAVGTGLSLAF